MKESDILCGVFIFWGVIFVLLGCLACHQYEKTIKRLEQNIQALENEGTTYSLHAYKRGFRDGQATCLESPK